MIAAQVARPSVPGAGAGAPALPRPASPCAEPAARSRRPGPPSARSKVLQEMHDQEKLQDLRSAAVESRRWRTGAINIMKRSIFGGEGGGGGRSRALEAPATGLASADAMLCEHTAYGPEAAPWREFPICIEAPVTDVSSADRARSAGSGSSAAPDRVCGQLDRSTRDRSTSWGGGRPKAPEADEGGWKP